MTDHKYFIQFAYTHLVKKVGYFVLWFHQKHGSTRLIVFIGLS